MQNPGEGHYALPLAVTTKRHHLSDAQCEYCLPPYSFVGTCGGYPGTPLPAYRICWWCELLLLLLL